MDSGRIQFLKARSVEHRKKGLCLSCTNPVAPRSKHCEEHLLYYRTKNAERRRAARAKGFCGVCSIRPCSEGKRTCAHCQGMRREYNAKKKLCRKCLSRRHVPGGKTCSVCLEQRREAQKLRRAARRAKGICRDCGKLPAVKWGRCEKHYRRHRLVNLTTSKVKYYDNKIKGTCVKCAKVKVLRKSVICYKCQRKASTWTRNNRKRSNQNG